MTLPLVGWFLCCLVAQSWRAGTYGFLLLTAAAAVIAYRRWRLRRLNLIRHEQVRKPHELALLGQYLLQLIRQVWVAHYWPSTARALQLTGDGILKRVPRIRKWHTTLHGTLVGYAAPGAVRADVDKYVVAAPKMAGMIRGGCTEVIVTPTSAGNVRFEFSFGDPLARELPLSKLPRPRRPYHLSYGVRPDGSPAELNYLQSVLIGGLTRHGKSVVGKAMLACLMALDVPVWLFVGDLKDGQELHEFSTLGPLGDSSVTVKRYATNEKQAEAMLDEVNRLALQRKDAMEAAGLKQWIPTREHPLLIAWLDETLPLEGKLGVNSPAGQIGYKGASRAAVMWLNTQLGEKAVLDRVRDLIPQALCFAVKTYQQNDMILGAGAHLAGALAHRIGNRPGVGYSGDEGDHLYRRFRAANVTPREAADLAQGKLPPGMFAARGARPVQHWLYRAYDPSPQWAAVYGARPVYIGIHTGVDPEDRWEQHRARGWKYCRLHGRWENFWQVHALQTTVVAVPGDRDALKREEQLAIETELPVFNVVHNRGGTFGRRVRARFVRRAAGAPKRRGRPASRPRQFEVAGSE